MDYIVKVENIMLYKDSAAIINEVNLTQKSIFIWVQWFRSNYEISIMLYQHHQITLSICSSGFYNSGSAAKQYLK